MLDQQNPMIVKRLALFSGNYNYVIDGPVKALNRLVGYLESQGVEVLVFAPTVKTPAFEHTGTLVSVPSFALPGRNEYRIGLGLTSKIRAQLAEFKPDLVHLSAPDLTGQSALKWAMRQDIPAVASFHTRFDTYPRYYGMPWLEPFVTARMRRFYQACDQVYVPSQSMADVLRHQDMAKDMRLWTRGVDMALYSPDRRDLAWRRSVGFDDTTCVISFVGRLVLEKGLKTYARVLKALQAKGLKVKGLIVGDGPERKRFQDMAPDSHFTGFLDGEDLARAYASSDIFFNGSVTETFGNVTLEAMASGLPAVCADATGSQTLISDGVSGYLIPVEKGQPSLDIFQDRLETLVADPEKRAAFAAASRDHARDYSWDRVLGSILHHYNEVLNTRRQTKACDPAVDPQSVTPL